MIQSERFSQAILGVREQLETPGPEFKEVDLLEHVAQPPHDLWKQIEGQLRSEGIITD